MSKNFVLVTGNMGSDVELKTLDSNKKVCNFSIAESYATSKKDENGKTIYETRWHNVTAWDGLAQKLADYSFKGQPVQVSGYLDYEEFKTDTKSYKNAKIVANEIELFAKFDYAGRKNSKQQVAAETDNGWT
jgi:single-strand DNA-binding protein